jgi:molecular chaperone DnaK (HSP70)
MYRGSFCCKSGRQWHWLNDAAATRHAVVTRNRHQLHGCDITVILPRNTHIHTGGTRLMTTTADNEFEGRLAVIEVDSLVDSILFLRIGPRCSGGPVNQVSYVIDAKGILSMTAEETASGHRKSMTIEWSEKPLKGKEPKRH